MATSLHKSGLEPPPALSQTCKACGGHFDAITRKYVCLDCRKDFCGGCWVQAGPLRPPLCRTCWQFHRALFNPSQLMRLKVRELRHYLHLHGVPTDTCREKEELVQLVLDQHAASGGAVVVQGGGPGAPDPPRQAAGAQSTAEPQDSDSDEEDSEEEEDDDSEDEGKEEGGDNGTVEKGGGDEEGEKEGDDDDEEEEDDDDDDDEEDDDEEDAEEGDVNEGEVNEDGGREDNGEDVSNGDEENDEGDDDEEDEEEDHESLDSDEGADLSHLSRVEDIGGLSVRQLKEILSRNFVNFQGCCEKWELMERVTRLYNECQDVQNKECATPTRPDENLCRICMDSPVDCVLLECGHMVTCSRCGKRMKECPICRQYVVRVVHVFRS